MRCSIRRVVSALPPILLIAAPALATPGWKVLGPFGGTVQTLTRAPSDPRVAYLTIEGEGAFRSLDGGALWVPVHRAVVISNMAVHGGSTPRRRLGYGCWRTTRSHSNGDNQRAIRSPVRWSRGRRRQVASWISSEISKSRWKTSSMMAPVAGSSTTRLHSALKTKDR